MEQLICPACSNPLSPLTVSGVRLDVCKGACGGVWFDRSELERFDDKSEFAPGELLRVEKNMQVVVDLNKPRSCPCCSPELLKQSFRDADYLFEVDSCLKCGGVWLDLGELDQLRVQRELDALRERIIKEHEQRYAAASGSFAERLRAIFKIIF